ncbi:16S rRNA (guanine(527)-N(7))-methyltransferase RsmG [Mammaliicoccus sciuri]|jgi:16S rRNA (guanine527-N7)-methyltransferase|uniref:16S rRNA (guanine(527)-N(7))-methyltransferase RsmG n=1 Tax=Mammaliicoccus sciuri TaxID=1296 RepID=UPI000733E3A2|nr:16S rRNA (guanine(527)-N(7))-methyltransferase RsmG [Mammaliicoccus sciuri]KTT84882.1 16S rRNA methyltransferase [Mammaliicoccus sciuri]MBA1397983.1 16S rRNA (guanine(527)-N(7))-methyltransferase RsmG [Mammaliicoccus sciuri]MBF0719609.1 16S rRNA (guanine(527)-N(7))-methyltransferase RsmG [Mammaliicoccus sciuri]MBF0773667.1 16S rRNA (guanine(527)-N(7))-methyltransferase RsmG [Mammaliicoccus sciuri]MBG9211305.1 16S rRNA (guanine(527)-N(7))-methyltransferase RsmG [Mammaliicoccus sciuri]
MNEQTFIDTLKESGITLTDKQIKQFGTYFEMLVEWNEKINLTAVTEKEEVYLKHFFDSVTPSFYIDFNEIETICDVGAGAGFPSIPLKIVYPHLQITIVDSLNKRIKFLNELAASLDLDKVNFVHDRAETFGKSQQYRESFDLVTARAVARLSVLSELCLPLVKKGGQFVALKGSQGNEELEDAQFAISVLGGEVKTVNEFTLPLEESMRQIITIDKLRQTPKKYPRKPGTPNKEPLTK